MKEKEGVSKMSKIDSGFFISQKLPKKSLYSSTIKDNYQQLLITKRARQSF
jgi:hypothetical protein